MANTLKSTYKIALDAMGGDFAPINEVQGAINACKNYKSDDLEIILVGNEKKIHSAISQFDVTKFKYSIVNADEVVTMDDEPSAALKKKKNSSLYKGMELHAQGYADAFVSAGNTGAVLSTATVMLKRINGVSRPTIGQFFPTQKKTPSFVLDVGANIDSKPRFMYEFAVMGSIYVNRMLGLENPRVGLLNIGEEPSKGTDIILQTYKLLEDSNLNFIGNIEGRDILQGTADIVVCDGFTGNIVLKFAESFNSFLKTKFKDFAKKNVMNAVVMKLTSPIIKRVMKDFDYQKYGGVPLLGVNGQVIIGHGKSSPLAIQNMIFRAVEFIKKDINKKIENALNKPIIKEQLR